MHIIFTYCSACHILQRSHSFVRFDELLREFGYRDNAYTRICFYENWERKVNDKDAAKGWNIEGGSVTNNVCATGRSTGRPNVLFSGAEQR